MFSDKGFADGANVARSSGSAAVMIMAIVTAVTIVDKNHAVNNAGQQTSVTENPRKQDWIKETVSEPIDNASQNIPLWIKVPQRNIPHAAAQLSEKPPYLLGYLGYACARAGHIDEAKRHLQGLQELAQKSYVPPMPFAMIYFGLGEIDRAFDWFEKATVEHDAMLLTIPSYFLFDPLHSHPRYKALLRKMNLA